MTHAANKSFHRPFHGMKVARRNPPAPVACPQISGAVCGGFRMQFCAAAKEHSSRPSLRASAPGRRSLRTGKRFWNRPNKDLPPPGAAPLQPERSICAGARVSSRYKFLTAARFCILIRVMLNSFFPAYDLAATAHQVQKRASPGLHHVYRHPPACNGGGRFISRCGNAVRQHGMHTAVNSSPPPVPLRMGPPAYRPRDLCPQAFKKRRYPQFPARTPHRARVVTPAAQQAASIRVRVAPRWGRRRAKNPYHAKRRGGAAPLTAAAHLCPHGPSARPGGYQSGRGPVCTRRAAAAASPRGSTAVPGKHRPHSPRQRRAPAR